MANLQVGVAGNGTVTVGAGASVHSPASNTLTLGTNNSERVRISSSGLVGIGTDTPASKLEVSAASAPHITSVLAANTDHITMTTGTTGGGLNVTTGNHFAINHQPFADRGGDSNLTERIRIASDGEILVPAAGANRLSMRHTSGGNFVIKNPTAATLSFGTNDNDNELTIANGGNVGVGTVTPGSLLHLGADSATAQLRIQRTNVAANTNDYGRIYWASYGGTLTGQLSVARESAENDGYMWFGTASSGTLTEKVRITSGGVLQIAPAGSAKMSFYHDSSGSLNHITSNNGNEIKVSSGNGDSNGIEFWDYTGVNKRCQIDAEGIKFNADTAAANGLDDYEEGSWNMTITPGSGSYTYGYGNTGYYVKIGKMVHCHAWVHLSPSSVSGGITWGGLPYTVKNTNRRQRVPIMGYGWSSITSSPQIIAELTQNGTTGSFSWLNDGWTTLTAVTAGNLGQSSEIYLNLTYETES